MSSIRKAIERNFDTVAFLCRNTIPNPYWNGSVLVTRYSDVVAALAQHDALRVPYAPKMDPSVGPFMLARENTIYNQRDKGIMRALLSPDDLPGIRKLVAAIAGQVIDRHHDDNSFDLCDSVARETAAEFVKRHFGFADASVAEIKKWGIATQIDMFKNLDGDKEAHENSVRAGMEMRELLLKTIARKKEMLAKGGRPVDILDRQLSMSLPEELGYDQERVLTNTMGLLVGTMEATAAAIAHIINELFRQPEALAETREVAGGSDDAQLGSYCREALRFNPITPMVLRNCVEDTVIASGTLRSRKIRKGMRVFVSIRSAMKDGRVIRKPGKFLPGRPRHHYLHFGFSYHKCLGTEIAEVLIQETVRALVGQPQLREISPMRHDENGLPSSFLVSIR